MTVVLDSWAVLRFLQDAGPAAEEVAGLLAREKPLMSWIRLDLDAARIKADHPMAFADAFAAALTVAQYAELWTGDPELLIEGGAAWRWHDLRS